MQTDKLRIAIDFDDCLGDCNGYALRETNQKYGLNLSLEEIVAWGKQGNDTDKRLECFENISFFERQPLLPGAKEFIQKLTANPNRDILIVTAIRPEFMLARAKRILEEFPELRPENIIMAARKEAIKVDVLLDDNPNHILNSIADYPVLFRRPWNQDLTGMLSINNYDEFLALVERIEKNRRITELTTREPLAICLVGPSGSGKTCIAQELAKSPLFSIPKSCTTRSRRPNEPEAAYHFLSKAAFAQAKQAGKFLETTSYASESYGMMREEIERLWAVGKYAVMAIDICGANAMTAAFGNRAVSVFVSRKRQYVIAEILNRTTTNEDKLNRIMSLDYEYANQHLCDQVLVNDKSVAEAAEFIFNFTKAIRT